MPKVAKAADSSGTPGSSPPGEVPVLSPEALQKLIREHELEEEKKRQGTEMEGLADMRISPGTPSTARWMRIGGPAYVLHKRRSLREARSVARPYDMRDLLGGEYNWATWMQPPLSGYSLHFSYLAFEFGKLQGNYLVEFRDKPKVYTGGYTSPFEKHPGGIPKLLDDLRMASENEFRPLVKEIGFKRPYREIQYVREDFCTLVSVITEAYGPDFFAYIQRRAQNTEVRRKYLVKTVEGYGLYDSTLQQPFNGPCILACLEKVFMQNAEQKDFKSKFGRKAKKDLMAYLALKEQREAQLEELYTRSADLPPGKMAGSAKTEAPDVPMETEAPESSSQGEECGVKVEPSESSLLEEASNTKDEHMGDNDEPMAPESSSSEEASTPDISPEKDAKGPTLHDQGIWGKCENVVDPEAFKRAAKEAETQNESAFNNKEDAKEKYGLEDTKEYQDFISTLAQREKTSPMYIRDETYDPVNAFKMQHMNWRVRREPHSAQKYTLSEEDLFKQLCNMAPIYERRPDRLDVIFRTGDVRATLDDKLMERASASKAAAFEAAALEAYDALLRIGEGASECNAPFFLGAGVDEEDIGDLSLDKIPNPIFFRFGLAEDGPVPIYTSITKCTALVVNLGNLARGRKRSAPSAFADYIDYDDTRFFMLRSLRGVFSGVRFPALQ
ncbi:unnamed protein product, partial [Symbiodinium sp. CCMP2456]